MTGSQADGSKISETRSEEESLTVGEDRRVLPDPADVPLDDVLASLVVVTVPMRVRFRGVREREVALVRGPAGWGEFSPFLEYDDPESAWWLASAIESAWVGWPSPLRDRVPVNATVPALAPEEVEAVLARFPGCRTVKIKVAEQGQALADDIARVDRVRRLVGPDVAVRVDANGAWDVDQAARALAVLGHYDLQYAEQPVRTLEETVRLRERLDDLGVGVALAVDEGIRKADDPFAVAATGAVDVAVVKVAPMGGVRRTLAVAAELAARHDVAVVVSSALDTSVGIAAGVAAAAALDQPGEQLACGLGTVGLLARDVAANPLLPDDGHLATGPVEPDPDLLRELASSPERTLWWSERVRRCHEVLQRRGSEPAR